MDTPDSSKGFNAFNTKKAKTEHASSATTHSITDEEYKIMQNLFMKNAGIFFKK